MTKALAWAVVATGARVCVNSVSDTRRAAIINWLVAEKKQQITVYHSDEQIEALWKHFGEYVDCKRVTITDDVSHSPQEGGGLGHD